MGKIFLQRCLLKKIKKKTKTLPKEELVLKLIKKKTTSKTLPREELVYCFKCMLLAVRHSDAIPKTKDGGTALNWICDQCESETGGSRAGVTNPGLSWEETQPVSYAEPLIRSMWTGMFEKDSRAGSGLSREEAQPVSYAEPYICSVWTGMFDVKSHDGPTIRVMHGVQAFLSSKACEKVHEAAALFQPALQLQMGPREKFWPKSFIDGSGPTDDSIAVYFFPSLAKQENYDKLVFEMLRDDLAMRASVGDAELLIFTSTMLPARFWRFQGGLFLWGVFRGKQVTVAVC